MTSETFEYFFSLELISNVLSHIQFDNFQLENDAPPMFSVSALFNWHFIHLQEIQALAHSVNDLPRPLVFRPI